MSTTFYGIVPMLMCQDVPRSASFYTDLLGFEVRDRMDDVGHSGWAVLQRGRARIMLASPTYVPRGVQVEGRFPQSCYYMYVEGIESLRERVEAGGHAATELVTRFYGMREFEVVDPEGHVLVFGEETNEPPTKHPSGAGVP